MLSGWGNLVFFDTEEHQIAYRKQIAQIPKLGSQWRIIHDFKPTEYLQAPTYPISLSLHTGDGQTPRNNFVYTVFPFPKITLLHAILNDNNQAQGQTVVDSTQLPKVGEWTRVEFGHEKVDDKYFLFLSVGGREVGRKEVSNPEPRKPTDVKVFLGHYELSQPGFIRRLVVLEKQ